MQERADEDAEASGAKALNLKPIHRKVAGEASDENDDGHYSQWTLRKDAALLLDNLSTVFDPALLVPCCLPEIQSRYVNDLLSNKQDLILLCIQL